MNKNIFSKHDLHVLFISFFSKMYNKKLLFIATIPLICAPRKCGLGSNCIRHSTGLVVVSLVFDSKLRSPWFDPGQADCIYQMVHVWHMPHGIDLRATPKNKYSNYLLCEQPPPAKIHSFAQHPFYCCKRFLGRNNTATTSAPHERCWHPLKGALLLANSTTYFRLFWRFFLSPLLMPS